MIMEPHQIYRSMMLEIKFRMRAIDSYIKDGNDNLPALEAEFCFLQFRKIVEQICFASIICDQNRYKDFRTLEGETSDKDSGDYTQDWNARIILKKLNDISPHFMPRPLGQMTSNDGNHHFDLKDINATHNKLVSIYKKCGSFMHIPKPFGEDYETHILNQRNRYKESIKTIKDYSKYFKELLWNHAAIGLEYNQENDKLESLELGNSKNAWIINFGDYTSDEIKIIIAIAQ
ncbi:hypothetical protein KA005_59180 [bacterium]|nr:hypothetical protein [bacterium]